MVLPSAGSFRGLTLPSLTCQECLCLAWNKFRGWCLFFSSTPSFSFFLSLEDNLAWLKYCWVLIGLLTATQNKLNWKTVKVSPQILMNYFICIIFKRYFWTWMQLVCEVHSFYILIKYIKRSVITKQLEHLTEVLMVACLSSSTEKFSLFYQKWIGTFGWRLKAAKGDGHF